MLPIVEGGGGNGLLVGFLANADGAPAHCVGQCCVLVCKCLLIGGAYISCGGDLRIVGHLQIKNTKRLQLRITRNQACAIARI